MTDIVVTTRNRLAHLHDTLSFIWERTRTPYRLTVIDDASDREDNPAWLLEQRREHNFTLVLRAQRMGARAAHSAATWLTFSDPFVLCDDDVLCPDLNPDWLWRGLLAMERRPQLAMLALHHPGAKTKPIRRDGEVTICRSLGATFLFINRMFAESLPGYEAVDLGRPMEPKCMAARECGWEIGYLEHVYCCHIGRRSELEDKPYRGRFIEPINWKTLEPPPNWKALLAKKENR